MTSDPHRHRILLVDDDAAGRAAMSEWLELEGHEPVGAADGEEALRYLHEGLAVVVTDLKMPRTDGLQLLKIIKEKTPNTAVIVVSGHGTVDTAVKALKEGAFDFLTKPINLKELSHRIKMALERRQMADQIADLHRRLEQRHGLGNMIGNSPAMRDLFEKIKLVADTNSTVLVTGESGTGKELVARLLHDQSRRKDQAFVPVNCAAIPEMLIESELFGHEKGAFTGASDKRKGLFQTAARGTLFVDEIGELPLGMQSKLLRVIESKRVMPVGSSKEIAVDVRLVAATNRNLETMVKEKEFREDLYYRLKVVVLDIPPLRERVEDIPLLVRYFVEQIARENDRAVLQINPDALSVLQDYDWPGNVRELRNTLEGIIVLSLKEAISAEDLPDHIRGAKPRKELIQPGMTMEQIECEAIRRTLEQTGGHRGEAAELLGVSVRTLQRKIKQFDLDSSNDATS